MKTVLKYPIPSSALSASGAQIEMENDAKVLSFQAQNGVPTLWVSATSGTVKARRKFRLVQTGLSDDVIEYGEFVGTIQVQGLVWHCFEERGP